MKELRIYCSRGNGKSFINDYIQYILKMDLINSLDDIRASNYVNKSKDLLVGYIIKKVGGINYYVCK